MRLEKALGPEYTILRINTCSMYMYVTSILGPTSDISNSLLHKRYIPFILWLPRIQASVVNDLKC